MPKPSQLDLDERREVTLDDYRRGSGLIQTFTPGLQPTIRDLVRQMIVTSDNIGTDIALGLVGLARVNAMLAQLGYSQTRINMTTADLSGRVFVLADPKYSTITDRVLYELGVPPVPPDELQRTIARDPANWLGRTTAREMSRVLLQLLRGELALAATTEEMLVSFRQGCGVLGFSRARGSGCAGRPSKAPARIARPAPPERDGRGNLRRWRRP